ncbi:sulfotransferase 1 family member D1-like, partial [Vanacampus margaritifer]
VLLIQHTLPQCCLRSGVKRFQTLVDQLASPRALVTHLPYQFMPPSFFSSKDKVSRVGKWSAVSLISNCNDSFDLLGQVIYVMRNPKDVIVSSYYFYQMAKFLEDPGTWDEFIDKFLEGRGLL